MRALTVVPGRADSAQLSEVAEPSERQGAVVVRTLSIGVCGTDHEIASGQYGSAPAGDERLIIGHESLGRVEAAPPGCGFAPGELVAGIVRRPDPVPCPSCAIGEWDMCSNGRYTERGIKGRHGYASERFRIDPAFLVKVEPALGALGVLLEPTSVVAKAWDQVARIGARGRFEPRRALVTGAGPIGLLAALLGRQRGLEVHVLDRVAEGAKPRLVAALGAVYHTGLPTALGFAPDIVMECTGASALVLDAIRAVAPNGIVCLTGVSSGGHKLSVDVGLLNRDIVLENAVIFGSVNANRGHYEAAAEALARADKAWLAGLISRREPLTNFASALSRQPDDIKVVIDFAA